MDFEQTHRRQGTTQTADQRQTETGWWELLSGAFTGWDPSDQSLEKIIDRMERTS